MLERIPDKDTLTALVGNNLYGVWEQLITTINSSYSIEPQWNSGGKNWTYEYKYRRGGKTMCALYAKENCIGLMIIFGKAEREKFENIRAILSDTIIKTYDDATTYHDGKWVMFEPYDASNFDGYMKMLEIKRKPNRK